MLETVQTSEEKLATMWRYRSATFFAAWALAAALLASPLPAESLTAEDIQEQVMSALDPNTDPCVDFYQYACGGWIAGQTLPDDEARVVRGVSKAEDDIRVKLSILLQDTADQAEPDSERIKLGDFFAACMDETAAKQAGLAALQPYLNEIESVQDGRDFLRLAGKFTAIGAPGLLATSILPTFFDASLYSLYLDPGKLGYPDPDIYLKNDKYNKSLRQYYQRNVAHALELLGESKSDAERHAGHIVKIESVLAKYHPDYGNSAGLYYATRQDLEFFVPAMDWKAFFQELGHLEIQGLFYDYKFLKALGKTLRPYRVDTFRAYLRWVLIKGFFPSLPDPYGKPVDPPEGWVILTDPPRWKQCVDNTSWLLGEAVGKTLVEEESLQALLPQAQEMVVQVEEAFRGRVDRAQWLDAASRASTEDKIDQIEVQLGFPAQWPDLSGLTIAPDAYLANTVEALKFRFQREMELYGESVDRSAWEPGLRPQTVDAFYFWLKNQIHLFAGMLRPSFFSPDYPPAMNYGGVGFVIAHELAHGFGHVGRFFDATGTYGELWSRKINRAFDRRAQCLTRQYARYETVPGLKFKVNGKRTLEENQADNNGLRLAYDAYKKAAENQADNGGLGDLTVDHLFFVSYAQNFCEAIQPERVGYYASRSWPRYAPNKYRVNGPVSNSLEFAAAFQCPLGAPMNPRKKCEIW